MAVGNNTPYLGYESYLGVAEETTFGTLVTATAFIEFTSEGFMKEREELLREEINTTRDYTRRMTGNETVSGSLEAPLNIASDAMVYLIKQAMGGTVASVSIVAGAIGHDLYAGNMEDNKSTSGAANVKSLTMQLRRGSTKQWSYMGMRVNTMTIKGEVGSPVVASFELMGRYGSTTTDSLTASFTNVDPLHFTGVTFQTGDSITNVSTEYINAFELTVSNNLAEQRNLGSANVHSLPPGRRDIKLKLTQQFDTTTSYDRYIQNTQTAIKLLLDTGSTISGAGSSTYSMYINLPACYFNSNTPQADSIDALSQEVDVSAIKDTSTSYVIQMHINNGTTTY